MRQIEKKMVAAIKARKNFKSGNTEVKMTRNEHLGTCTAMVYLYDNLIAKISFGPENVVAQFTMAGWNKNTTRSRLNALGVGVSQCNWAPYHNGKAISSKGWYTFDYDYK